MKRIAVIGGGIAGLSAAYELEKARKAGVPIDWHLYEATKRLGGTVQTTRHTTAEGEGILEGGPEAWVTEKPWARELAEELGLADETIACNEAGKKTYAWVDGELLAMPERMRMMVPEDLSALDASPLFSPAAKQSYAQELARAEELKASIPAEDESVASFVRRHFGDEVLDKIGAPLLSGVFGGDVAKLSVHAVMAAFTKMEAEHGSLIKALQEIRQKRGEKAPQPTFTTLRRGMETLTEAIVAALPADRLHTRIPAAQLAQGAQNKWLVRFAAGDGSSCAIGFVPFDEVVLATPVDATRRLLNEVDEAAADLIPKEASSAVLTTFCWRATVARSVAVPPGFGFLVPQHGPSRADRPRLLAGTFTTQKFPDRAPDGARILRVFFGGEMAEKLNAAEDHAVATEAWRELNRVLADLPAPEGALTTVARWAQSLPQYHVGHEARMDRLAERVEALGHLSLLGNGYHGVGVPDLIRDARHLARKLTEETVERITAP